MDLLAVFKYHIDKRKTSKVSPSVYPEIPDQSKKLKCPYFSPKNTFSQNIGFTFQDNKFCD